MKSAHHNLSCLVQPTLQNLKMFRKARKSSLVWKDENIWHIYLKIDYLIS